MPDKNKADQEQDMKKLEETAEKLEQDEATYESTGVAGAVLKGLGSLIPGLGTVMEGLKESDAFQEKLAAINQRLETRLTEAPLKETDAGRTSLGLQRRSGISMRTLAPDRMPAGIPRGARRKVEKPPQRKLAVDVFDEGDHLLIVAELPGVAEKDIRVGVEDNRLTLSASSVGREYAKELTLPCPAGVELDRSYKNGILQVKLAKKARG